MCGQVFLCASAPSDPCSDNMVTNRLCRFVSQTALTHACTLVPPAPVEILRRCVYVAVVGCLKTQLWIYVSAGQMCVQMLETCKRGVHLCGMMRLMVQLLVYSSVCTAWLKKDGTYLQGSLSKTYVLTFYLLFSWSFPCLIIRVCLFNNNAPFVKIAPFLQKHQNWEKENEKKIEPNVLPTEKHFSTCCLPSTLLFWLVWENWQIKVSQQQMPTFALKLHSRAKTPERALCSINNVWLQEAVAGQCHKATRGSKHEQQLQNEGRILGITVKWPSCNNPCRSAALALKNAAVWPGQRQIYHCSYRRNTATSQTLQTGQHLMLNFPPKKTNFTLF